MSTPNQNLDSKLLLLWRAHSRHLTIKDGKFGFAPRGYTPDEVFPTLEEAIENEAKILEAEAAQKRLSIKRLEGIAADLLANAAILREKP